MFKPLSVPFLEKIHSKDESVNRLQIQLESILAAIGQSQRDLFVVERNLLRENENVKDTLIYQDDSTPYVSIRSEDLQNPVFPLGIGRSTRGNKVQVSTLLHYSDLIKAGRSYTLNAAGLLVPSSDRRSAVVIGIIDGVGSIQQRNLPLESLL